MGADQFAVEQPGEGSTVVLISPSRDDLILTVAMELIQRGLMPVVILIDPSSFGGKTESLDLKSKLARHGILTYRISEGDDLQKVLERPNIAFDTKLVYKN